MMEWFTQLVISLAVFTVFTILAYLWIRWHGVNLREMQPDKVRELENKIRDQDKKIQTLIEELLDEKRKSEALEQRIAELEREKGLRIGMKVLGIWPRRPQDTPLDLEGARDAVYDAGFEFVPLFAEAATRQNILHYIRKGEISIIEIGGHGTEDGVPLADGVARAGWWEQILKGRTHVRIVLFLTCFSDQTMYNAVNRAGVPNIITVNGEIGDAAAVSFAQAFYSNYANGQTVAQAVREAKLILDYTEAAKIELSKTVSNT